MIAKPEHEIAYQDLTELLRKHSANVSSEEMLAIASNMIGKLIALQDQRTITNEKAYDILMKNISVGNKQAIDGLMNIGGTKQ